MVSLFQPLVRRSWRVAGASILSPRRSGFATTISTQNASVSPLLSKLRVDLKTAMKEKDKDRLNVLRGLLADVTNAAKTPNPVVTDLQVLGLLRKRTTAARAASQEFSSAGREDLVAQELRQVHILEEYAGQVDTMETSDITLAIEEVVAQLRSATSGKLSAGDVLKRLLGPGGSLEGKSVEKSEVAKLVKQTLS